MIQTFTATNANDFRDLADRLNAYRRGAAKRPPEVYDFDGTPYVVSEFGPLTRTQEGYYMVDVEFLEYVHSRVRYPSEPRIVAEEWSRELGDSVLLTIAAPVSKEDYEKLCEGKAPLVVTLDKPFRLSSFAPDELAGPAGG